MGLSAAAAALIEPLIMHFHLVELLFQKMLLLLDLPHVLRLFGLSSLEHALAEYTIVRLHIALRHRVRREFRSNGVGKAELEEFVVITGRLH